MGLIWLLPPITIVAWLAIGTLALLPTRRLFLAGWGPRALLGYLVTLVALGGLALEARSALRYLLPVLVLVYVAPFVIPPPIVARVLRPRSRRPPPKDVTPRPPALGPGRQEADETGPSTAQHHDRPRRPEGSARGGPGDGPPV